MKFPAIYGVSVGVLVIAQWIFFLATGAVPELHTAPWSIGFHLAAEFVMAAALIAGGMGMWQSRQWGAKVLLSGLGMAIYSEIVSPGYFAQQGAWGLVIMFAVLLAGALIGLQRLKISSKE